MKIQLSPKIDFDGKAKELSDSELAKQIIDLEKTRVTGSAPLTPDTWNDYNLWLAFSREIRRRWLYEQGVVE